MIIKNIKMINFGPFYGEHEINFENGGYGVHIIRGNTGQGKTSILRALLWCLYGKVFDRKNKEIPPSSLLNFSSFDDGIYDFSVSLLFEHEGDNWSIKRRMKSPRHTDSGYRKNMELYVIKDITPQPNDQLEIERIIPSDVNGFFFFDGEMLRDYEELLDQSSSSMKMLKSSIEHVLGIPYLRIGRDDLKAVNNEYEKEENKILKRLGDQEYDELAELREYIINEINRREELIKKLQKQIDELEREITIKKRRQIEIEGVKDIAQKRMDLEEHIRINEELKKQYLLSKQKLNTGLYKTVLKDISVNIIKSLEAKHAISMEKYDKKQKMIKHLSDLDKSIKNVKCELCGNVLNPEKLKEIDEEMKITKDLIEQLTEVPEPNLEYDHSITILNNMNITSPDRSKYNEIDQAIEKIDYDLASMNSQLEQISEKIQESDLDEPFRLEKEILRDTEEIGRIRGEIKTETESLNTDLGTKSEIEQKLKSINKNELNIITKRKEYTKTLINIYETAISSFRESRKNEVESLATDIFKKIRSKESFSRLIINENYGLGIITTSGRELSKAEWRSAGEEQIVAYALIGALNRCAQIKAPIFMDTPFARLDIKHGKNIMTYVPSISEQVVLLVTDREFGKEDEKILKGKIKTDYTVIFRSEEKGSELFKTRTSRDVE